MAVDPDDLVNLQLKIKYTEALIAIKKVLQGYTDMETSAQKFGQIVLGLSQKWNMSWKQTLSILKQVDKELGAISARKVGPMGGGLASTQLFSATKDYLAQAEKAQGATTKLSQGLNSVEPAANSATKGLFSLKNVARVALGTLEAMGIFLVIQFVKNAIKKAIDGVRQLELAIYKLSVAEKSLSEAGIDISLKDFRELSKEIKILFPYLSKIDISKLVSDVALLTKDLGLSREQLSDLVKTIPQLAINAGVSIESATDQVVNGLANHGKGWKDLGIIVNAEVIRQKAVAFQLVATEEEYKNLTAEQRQQIDVLTLIQIAQESAMDGQANMDIYMKTLDERLKETSSSWEDLVTVIGSIFAPLIISLGPIFDWLAQQLEQMKVGLAGFLSILEAISLDNLKLSPKERIEQFNANKNEAFKKNLQNLFPGGQSDNERVNAFLQKYIENADTATAATNELNDALGGLDEDQLDKLNDSLEDLYKDLEKLQQKAEDMEQDFQIEQARDQSDHLLDMRRNEQDYQISRQRAIEDANKQIEDINQKDKEKQLLDEAKFQEQLRQLREKFLFNLEDALHERDARSVLRLQRQYQMDKQNLINENNLKKKNDEIQKADDAKKVRDDLAQKLSRMDEEHRLEVKRKEEDYRLKKRREEENHSRDMADLRRQITDRLTELSRALGSEFNLNESGVTAIYNLLNKFYGPSGYFDGLYTYSYNSMVARAKGMMAALTSILSNGASVTPTMPSLVLPRVNDPGGHASTGYAHARGGSFLATRPTKAMFGEKGPEIANFMPLRNIGNNGLLGGMDKSMSMGGESGKIKIEMLLSPDLEARIIENSMSRTAEVLVRVQNSKRR